MILFVLGDPIIRMELRQFSKILSKMISLNALWIAGFITEYSSVLFSLILFTEYASIISLSLLIIIIFSLYYDCLMFFLFYVCLIRATLNRFKYDELMTNA